MKATITVQRTTGAPVWNDGYCTKYELDMRVSEGRPFFIHAKETDFALEAGNFGYNLRPIYRWAHIPYKTKASMRAAITRMMRNRGYNIVKWEWKD